MANVSVQGARGRASILGALKYPALVLLIIVNLLYFGGNAAVDLWQTVMPAEQFSGVITAHEIQTVGSNDNRTQLLTLTVRTDTGELLTFDVTQRTYDLTSEGQRVVGEQDRAGFLDHNEALRKLTADGRVVFDSHPVNRAIDAALVLVVALALSALALRWIYLSWRRSRTRTVSTG